MKKPLIGISTLLFKDVTGATPANPMTGRFFANRSFVRSVIEAGGVPVLLPGTFDKDCIDEYLNTCDGFIMVGGPDANPVLFGEEPSEKARMGNTTVDMHDTAMIRAVLAMDKPILGVCRGMQMLNLAMGGTIYQDLSEYEEELKAGLKNGSSLTGPTGEPRILLHRQPGPEGDPYHMVKTVPGTKTAEIFGEKVAVNSHHHQAVKDPAPGAVISASAMDGVVEAVEFPDKRFAVGLQWHPEIMTSFVGGGFAAEQLKVFEALIAAARR